MTKPTGKTKRPSPAKYRGLRVRTIDDDIRDMVGKYGWHSILCALIHNMEQQGCRGRIIRALYKAHEAFMGAAR